MEEQGVVEKTDGRQMTIRLQAARPEMCRRCRACEILGEGQGMVLTVPAIVGLKPGDPVVVEIPEASPWTGMLLVFALPIAGLVGGLALGSRWAWWVNLLGLEPDLCGVVLGVPLAALAILFARLVDRRYRRRIRVSRVEGSDSV
jgi:positive regulator of sigma E activity